MDSYVENFDKVPALILPCLVRYREPTPMEGASVYPAVQNFLLACRNEGLGCVLTTLLCYEEPEVRRLLGMPEGWYTCAHGPVGYPVKGGHGPISRNSLDKMVSFNAWAD